MTVRLAFQATWATIRDLWDEMFILIFCNILWFVALIPFAMLAYLTVSMGRAAGILLFSLTLFSVVIPSIVTGGIFYLTHKIADGRAVSFADFKHGVRTYFRQSALQGLTFMVIALVLLVNLYFYGRYAGLMFRIVQIVFVYLLAVWVLMQLYIFPLLLEQEEQSLRLATRNALILVLRHPDFSVVIGLVALALTALSGFLTIPAVILLGSALALLGNRAVFTLLSIYRGEKNSGAEDRGWQLDDWEPDNEAGNANAT